jgi:hypothetical protein
MIGTKEYFTAPPPGQRGYYPLVADAYVSGIIVMRMRAIEAMAKRME